MMKRKTYVSVFAALLLAFGFAGCTSEEFYDAQDEGGVVSMTVGIRKAGVFDGDTRTSLSETETGDLKCVWESDDRIMVSDANGDIKGYLSLTDGDGTNFAHFHSDNLERITADTQNLNFVYLGREKKQSDLDNSAQYKYISLFYNNQTGTMESLSDKDILVKTGVSVSVSDGKVYTADGNDVVMTRPFAFGHFTLAFPDGVSRTNEKVTITAPEGGDDGIRCAVNLHYNGQIGIGNNNKGISVNGQTGNDLYITIPMQDNSTVTPTFSVTINGKEYTGSLPERRWSANEYVRKGVREGVTVDMSTEKVIDHSKNPLLKWADTNLDLSKETGFANNLWDRGQLFQFGRNCGYTDYKDARSRYAVYCSINTDSPWNTWGFNVYNGNGNGGKVTYSYSMNGTSNTDPDSYFWIADEDCGATNNDWWPQRSGLNDNWSTRATADGWSKGDPSPDGWHIATTNEYNEIMPSNLSGSSASVVFGKGEIRKNRDCTYAISWDIIKKTLSSEIRYVLMVKCLVVAEGTSYSDVDWEDENVKVKYFPAAGYINSGYTNFVYWYLNGYGNNINYWIAREYGVNPGSNYIRAGNHRAALPCPTGRINYPCIQVGQNVAVKYEIVEDHSNFRTSYWTADGDCFGFSYDLGKKWSDPYFIGMHKSYKKTFAMPLRCVRDN